MTRKWIAALLFMLLLVSSIASAQNTGQLCINAFEDRNGNGQDDSNEPRISQFLDATLQDGDGVIISTLTMRNSPTAASGLLCFQRLEPGQYTISVRSAKFVPTTEAQFITAVSGTGVVQNFSYGGQIIPAQALPAQEDNTLALSEAEQEALLRRLLVAGLGAAVVLGAMAVVGAFLAFIIGRSRRRRPAPAVPFADERYATGRYTPVTDTGSQQPIAPLPMDIYDDDEPIPLDKPDNFVDSFRFTEEQEDTDKPASTEPEMPEVDDDSV